MFSYIAQYRKTLVLLILVVIVLGVLVYERISPHGFLSRPQNDLKTITPEESASYTDLDGNPVDFAMFRGKPLIVNAWASWMPFSQTELPLLISAKNKYGDAVTIVAINRMEDTARIKAFLDAFSIPRDGLIYLADPTDFFYRAVSGYAMPETVFFRADGVIQNHVRGTLNEGDLTQYIDALIAP